MSKQSVNMESIEWLRKVMVGFNEFQCRCGKQFTDFELWWNHMFISKHIILTDQDIEHLKEFVKRYA